MKEAISNKVKAHTRYKLKDGTIVPGVTTIVNLLDKPQLKLWANRIGLQGIEMSKYVDDKAEQGTLAHEMILCHLKNEKIDTSDHSKNVIDAAENSFLSYLEWEKPRKIEPIYLEHEVISELYKFGGKFDFFGKIDGILTIMDFKTGKGIYPEFFFQLAGYGIGLKEEGKYIPEKYAILNIPRDESESFKVEEKSNMDIQRKIFVNLASIYHLKKELK